MNTINIISARKSCYEGWKIEYNGYLMTGKPEHRAGSMYTCVDGNPDTLHGGRANKDGYLFYLVEGRCGSLKCPPYVEGRELTCVVCSKEWKKKHGDTRNNWLWLYNLPIYIFENKERIDS